jgi:hypothetical protein
MHLADDPTPQDLLLKGSANGKDYIGPPGPAGGEKDREIVSVGSNMLVTRFVNPDAATRYGNMVYVRLPEEREDPPPPHPIRHELVIVIA